MKKLTIFEFIRDPRDVGRILSRRVLRVVNVHPSFIGIGDSEKDVNAINRAEFKRLADSLETSNDGFFID